MDLMIDIETLDTKPGATILSIGAVLFDRKTAWSIDQGMFYMEVNIASQLPYHTTVSADTMDFWAHTNPEWIERIMSDAYQAEATFPVDVVFKAFDDWLIQHYTEGLVIDAVWAQGQDFDFPILAELYRRVREGSVNNSPQWSFWSQRDTRTAYDISGFDPGTVKRTGQHHRALDDCHHQIKCLWFALNNYRPFNNLSPAEAERLAMLSEEAGKVVQAIGKILRHGYQSFHPDRPHVSNRELLNNELADLSAVQLLMEGSKDVFRTGNEIEHAMKRKLKFTHHQEPAK